MNVKSKRALSNGHTVEVHANNGLRKICGCPRRHWPKCPHPWHFSYRWKGTAYRFSLERHVGRVLSSKTEAQEVAEGLKASIRQGRLHETPVATTPQHSGDISFETFGEIFVERFSKAREKVSWYDDASMLRQLMAFPIRWNNATRLGEKPLGAIVEDDLEAFLRHLLSLGRAVSTRNHYVQLMRAMSRWSVRKGYRTLPFVLDDSDMIRRKKAGKRNRRLEPGEEEKLLAAANPPLQRFIIAALETCCRNNELLSLQWRDVSLGRREIMLRAAKTKTSTDRVIPISDRLQAVLELVRHDPAGQPFGPLAHVFGDELGRRIKSAKRAWQTAVLKAHGHMPVWVWKKNRQGSGGSGRLDHQSQAAYRSIDLHFHDLRHEAGSRLLEAGWPLHEVQQMLGHANLQQTSTYLNATLRGMHRSMRTFERTRTQVTPIEPVTANPRSGSGNSLQVLASDPACAPLTSCKAQPNSDDKSLIH
jgi:integrase